MQAMDRTRSETARPSSVKLARSSSARVRSVGVASMAPNSSPKVPHGMSPPRLPTQPSAATAANVAAKTRELTHDKNISHTSAAAAAMARDAALQTRKRGKTLESRGSGSRLATSGAGNSPAGRSMKLDLKLRTKEARDKLFRRLDEDGSGRLTHNEIELGLRSEYLALDTLIKAKRRGNQLLKRAHRAAERAIGGDEGGGKGDGLVSRHEFRLFVEYVEYFANMWDAFEEVDMDGDGNLTLKEFQDGFILIEPECTLTSEELALEFQHVDKNGGGSITFNEFCTWMAQRRQDDAPKVHARQQKTKHDLELVLSCSGLELVKGIDISALDTQAVVSEVKRVANPRASKDRHGVPMASVRDVTYELLGHTEVVKRCRIPNWTQFVDVELEEASNPLYQQQVSVSVFLVNAKGQQIRELGLVTFGLQDLYSARWRRMTFPLQSRSEALSNASVSAGDKRPRISVCAVERAPSRHKAWVRMQFQAANIPLNTDHLSPQTPNKSRRAGVDGTPSKDAPRSSQNGAATTDTHNVLSTAGRPSTYLQVSRQLQGFLQPFYRSELIEKNCNPCWRDQGVSFQQFCAGDDDCQLLIELYQVEEVTLMSGGTAKVCEQRDELRLGQLMLTAREIFEAGHAQKVGDVDGSTFVMEADRGSPSLAVLQLVTYFPEKGTQRKELHLEDKHFASDREFLSELLGAHAVTGDVAEKVDEAQRYVEQCAQSWITRRKEDAEQDKLDRRRTMQNKRRQSTPVLYDANGQRMVESSDDDSGSSDESVDTERADSESSATDSKTSADKQADARQNVSKLRRSQHGSAKFRQAREKKPRYKVSQMSKVNMVSRGREGRASKPVNLWLPSTVAFANGSKAERMAIFGLKEHQKRLDANKAARARKPEAFKVDPQISAVLDKAGARSWLRTPASGVTTPRPPSPHSPQKKKIPSPRAEGDSTGDKSPQRDGVDPAQQDEEEQTHVRVSGHLINKENDHGTHYDEQLSRLEDGTKLMSSTIEHKRLKSPRWAHTNMKLYSKNRLGDEWVATAMTLENAPEIPVRKTPIETPNRKPLYVKPEPKGAGKAATEGTGGRGGGKSNPYTAAKAPTQKKRKKKRRPLGAPACATVPTKQEQGQGRHARTADGGVRFSRPPADPSPYRVNADPRLAEKVKAAKDAKAEQARKEHDAKERKAIGAQQLVDWLSEVGQIHLLRTFHREGFHSLADVRNADLGQEDLALLGIMELDKQQMALEMLATNYAELGKKCAMQIQMGLAKLGENGKQKKVTLAEAGLFLKK